MNISSKMRYEKRYETVNGKRMAYVESGTGDPIVFLHGNPTSSYLWRNVIPYCEGSGRCIAPDLIGMGDSEKLENSGPHTYQLKEHALYLAKLLEQLGVTGAVVLVIHDWGSALGVDWARRHSEAVDGIAVIDALVPYTLTWSQMGDRGVQDFFRALRGEAGERMILEDNLWIEQNMPNQIVRKLTVQEMEEYRRPFRTPGEGRRPMLTLARSVPIDGEPRDVSEMLKPAFDWLETTRFPKLLIDNGESLLEQTARTWTNFSQVSNVPGRHFLQEDSPDIIGAALAEWLADMGRNAS